MNTSERKTLRLMKLVSFGTICIILVVLYLLAQKQNKASSPLVASTKIELLPLDKVINIKALPWLTEDFTNALSNQKINYINYWAQWCEPCLTEIPHLKKIAKKNSNLNLVFVNVDSKDNLKKAKAWWAKNIGDINTYYPKYEKNILKHTRGLPYHQIYNKKMDLVSHFTGNIENKEDLVNQVIKEIN